jgi:hypothetical protein
MEILLTCLLMGRTWRGDKTKKKPTKKDRREQQRLEQKPIADRYTPLRPEPVFKSSYKSLKIEE